MDDSLRDALNKILSLQDRSKRKLEGRQKEFLESLYQDLELIYVKDDVYVDGDVIKCKCRSTKEKVAIKIINIPEEQKKNGVPSSVIRLVSILKALDDHPNIIRLMYVAGTEDEVYLSFEQFDETSLHRYLCYRHLFSRPQELKFILHEILSGVAHCHAHKILHRDLTPHNILLQTHPDAAVFPENVKLTGFGEASTFEIPHSSESAHVCHPFYRAPEHLLGSTEYSTASDIWSVGCIFAEMFKRKPLFNGDDNVWMLAQIFCLLGPPTEETWPGLSKLCNFEVVLDPTKKPKSLEEEFRNLGPAGVDLLSGFSKNFKNLLPIVLESFPSFGFRLKETIKKTVAGKSSCRLFQNLALVVEAVDALHSEFRAVDNLVAYNTNRVLKAFQNARVGSHHFGGCTGYGHDEAGGRGALDQAFAEIVGAESAIVRSQFFSGTHAITCALFALLRPGDELLAVAGAPYDTLEEVIGKRDSGGMGSLQDFGVKYREVPLAEDGGLDWNALMSAVKPKTKCALIQRSCGYSWRQSLSVNDIGRAIKIIKMQNPECSVMVDNCYGEFVESIEPPMVDADLMAGSLIKNPGGTIAPCGGYVAGKKKWVEAAAARLSAPGLGVDCGSTPADIMRVFFQGLFLSPQMVGEAIKGSFLIAETMASKGYKVQPLPRVPRHDTVQAVQLGSRERLLAFCEAVQRSSPVGSYTKPVAGTTPGYASEVIFADGTFIDGSTSELSCDGPLREPFAVFCQGGTHWTQWGLVLGEVLKSI